MYQPHSIFKLLTSIVFIVTLHACNEHDQPSGAYIPHWGKVSPGDTLTMLSMTRTEFDQLTKDLPEMDINLMDSLPGSFIEFTPNPDNEHMIASPQCIQGPCERCSPLFISDNLRGGNHLHSECHCQPMDCPGEPKPNPDFSNCTPQLSFKLQSFLCKGACLLSGESCKLYIAKNSFSGKITFPRKKNHVSFRLKCVCEV